MSNHAPGPWTVNGQTVKSICHQRHYAVARVHNPLMTPEANRANATLIAAAPELLDALQTLVEAATHHQADAQAALATARAAIAKATEGKP